jgi:hypothetical protein
MTRIFSVDVNNDLILASDGNLAISEELDAILQACEHAAKAQLSEMVLAADQGMPNFQTIWNGSPNVPQFEAYLRRQLLAVEGVTDVVSIDASVANNVLAYTAVIKTQFGQGAVNG